jgi:hypothetical protein
LSECQPVEVELTGTETETESEEEQDIVLKESRKGQNAFLDNEAEVSGDDDDDEDYDDDEEEEEEEEEGSGGDEAEVVEDVACGEPQGTDPREKSTFGEVEVDLPGDGSQAGET